MVWFGKANLQGEGGERIKANEETVFEMARGREWWKVEQNKDRGKERKVWVKGTAESGGREEGEWSRTGDKKKSSLKLEKINSSLGLNRPLLLEPAEGKATVELSQWVSGQ